MKRSGMEPSWWSRLKYNLFGDFKVLFWIYGIGVVLALSFWAAVIYVAYHFISKYW